MCRCCMSTRGCPHYPAQSRRVIKAGCPGHVAPREQSTVNTGLGEAACLRTLCTRVSSCNHVDRLVLPLLSDEETKA